MIQLNDEVSRDSPLDVSDCRDFLAGAFEGGLVCQLPGGALIRAPYALPYVFPSDRASVPLSGDKAFSLGVWQLSEAFFKKVVNPILLEEADPGFQKLMRSIGFKEDDSLESICRWHIEKLRISMPIDQSF